MTCNNFVLTLSTIRPVSYHGGSTVYKVRKCQLIQLLFTRLKSVVGYKYYGCIFPVSIKDWNNGYQYNTFMYTPMCSSMYILYWLTPDTDTPLLHKLFLLKLDVQLTHYITSTALKFRWNHLYKIQLYFIFLKTTLSCPFVL